MRRGTLATIALALPIVVGACGKSGSNAADTTAASTVTSTADTTAALTVTSAVLVSNTAGGGVDPNAPEVVEPGDIPDDQVFVTYHAPDAAYSVDVPEGWSRTVTNGVVTFSDKYNSVTIAATSGTTQPTVDSVRSGGLADVANDPTFTLLDVAPVTRSGGEGVLATYEIGSEPNAVTGRSALLSVERYVFFRDGVTIVLTLSGAKGADNVDPWRIVSDSVTWT